MIRLISLIIFSEIWHTAGQILFKKTTNQLDSPTSSQMKTYAVFFRNIALSPWIWLGFIFMALSIFFWLMALAQGDLSLVYPLGSTQYITTMIAARLLLNEKIDRMKFWGTMFVVAGIVVIAGS